MKQNSSILFHFMRKPLRIGYLLQLGAIFLFCLALLAPVGAQTEYLQSYDPAKGFKPAQRDLTEIFLQIAGSIEAHGSPEPYLRHMTAERVRVEERYRQKFGTAPKSYWPEYMTEAYVTRFAANWKVLAVKFGLEPLAKDVGHTMRNAIKGTRDTGTVLVDVFNQHQACVFEAMAGKNVASADFETLKSQILTTVEYEKEKVDAERYEIARRDAVDFVLGIRGSLEALYQRLDKNLSPADAKKVKGAITGIFTDIGRLAQCELQLGILEWAIDGKDSSSK